jgi:hypothetical protein
MVQPKDPNDYVMLDQNDPNFRSKFDAAQKEGRIPGEPVAVGGDYGTGDRGKARDRLNDPEAQRLLAKSILLGDQSPEALRVQNDLALLLASNPVTGAIDPLPTVPSTLCSNAHRSNLSKAGGGKVFVSTAT